MAHKFHWKNLEPTRDSGMKLSPSGRKLGRPWHIILGLSRVETVFSVFVENGKFLICPHFWGIELQWSWQKACGIYTSSSPWHAVNCSFCLLSPLRWLKFPPLSSGSSWLLSLVVIIYQPSGASSGVRVQSPHLSVPPLSGILALQVDSSLISSEFFKQHLSSFSSRSQGAGWPDRS